MPVSFRLGAFYFLFFVCAGLMVAYVPPYLAARGLERKPDRVGARRAAARAHLAPGAWGGLRTAPARCARSSLSAACANALCFALLPAMQDFRGMVALMGLTSLSRPQRLPLVEAITLGALAGEPGTLWPDTAMGLDRLHGGRDGRRRLARFPLGAGRASCDARFHPRHGGHRRLAAAGAAALTHGTRARLGRTALAVLASGFCMAAAHGTLYAFFTLHLQRLGYSSSLIGFLWMLGVLAEVVVFLFLPALFRRYLLSTLMMASAALGVVRFLVIGWVADWLLLLLPHKSSMPRPSALFHAAAVAAVQRLFAPHAQARGQTLFSSVATAQAARRRGERRLGMGGCRPGISL